MNLATLAFLSLVRHCGGNAAHSNAEHSDVVGFWTDRT